MPRSLRSGREGVVAHTPCFKTHFETFRCERPPRRFAPPLLCKEGNVVPKNFVKKTRTYSLVVNNRILQPPVIRPRPFTHESAKQSRDATGPRRGSPNPGR